MPNSQSNSDFLNSLFQNNPINSFKGCKIIYGFIEALNYRFPWKSEKEKYETLMFYVPFLLSGKEISEDLEKKRAEFFANKALTVYAPKALDQEVLLLEKSGLESDKIKANKIRIATKNLRENPCYQTADFAADFAAYSAAYSAAYYAGYSAADSAAYSAAYSAGYSACYSDLYSEILGIAENNLLEVCSMEE